MICMICALIFFNTVGTHLNDLNNFINAYVVGTHLNCNADEYPQHML